ncbi:type-F conjugative transfer system pilin assembly protein TraF [Serratia fonticola]|uniref:Type-F conjugative transfer system pilin assembly protein TraF n=1 Tax=Serratia fonticola TaxID=47917 RepID=A0AAJ2D8N2_SERFO|nr:type-F conjugative transfer system pilin assembly protein TraF [Serratia fonticola]MDQ9128467.1 type-F conjugative transfer system pilin assembly protein TraF [Serratia fonticola]
MKALPLLLLVLPMLVQAAPEETITARHAEELGWHWYNPQDEEQDPPPAMASPERLHNLSPSAQKKMLQQATREALDTAILYPTAENFKRFMTFQNYWTDQATAFTQSSKEARLKYPELDYNLVKSHYNGTAAAQQTVIKERQNTVAREVAERFGLFFFYRGNNPVDALMASVIKAFCAERGISLMAVTVDGKISEHLPQSRVDSGQAEHMNVKFFPATLLVDPRSKHWQPLAYGFMSHDDLDSQMVSVLTHFTADY